MQLTLVNLLGVSVIAFLVPCVLGLFPRCRIPATAMELVAGILVGPSVLGWIEAGPVVKVMATIGVAFLLFLAGLDLHLKVLTGPPLLRGSFAFLVSFGLAYALMAPLGAKGVILSPLLCSVALSATSLGIVSPYLRDLGQSHTPVGRFTMSTASIAEVCTIGLLGVFFAESNASAAVSALLLALVAVLGVLLVAVLRLTQRWAPGRIILDKLDDTSAQSRVRFSVMVFLAAAAVTMQFGFEGILGSFLAGIVVRLLVRGDRFESSLRIKLEGIGFGLFVPAFFVTTGLEFELSRFGFAEMGRSLLFLAALLVIKTVPTVLYRPFLTWRECLASGILQSTNLSFIVVSVAVGKNLGLMREINGAALIMAGLASALIFPSLGARLLSHTKPEPHGEVTVVPGDASFQSEPPVSS